MFSAVLSVFVLTLASIPPQPLAPTGPPVFARIPIVIHHGETVAQIGELAENDRLRYPPNTVIGYKYSRFGIFWVDIWTWGGEYCVYDGNRFVSITPEVCAALLKTEVNSLTTPVFYRFPLGLLILAGIVIVLIPIGMVTRARERQEQARIRGLFDDSRYQEALQIFERNLPPTPEPILIPADADAESHESVTIEPEQTLSAEQQQMHFDEAIKIAVDYLVHNGEDRDVAQANLHLILSILSQR